MAELEFVVSEGAAKGKAFAFPGHSFVIGSSPDCQLRFEPNAVRSRHAAVSTDNAGVVWVRDISGASLVWINGQPANEGKLSPGTFLRLGRLELVVRQKGAVDAGPSGTISSPKYVAPSRSDTANMRRMTDPEFGLDETVNTGNRGALGLDATAKRPTPLHSGPMDDSGVERAMDRARQMAEAEKLGPRPSPTQRGLRSQLMPGQVIDGRYKVIARLAAGGMGEVYKAEHIELGKIFAIKVMLPDLSSDQEFVARFKREAIASSRIGQQNIVDISDFGRTQDGRFYFVMEFLDGLTLASVVHRNGALALERMVNISLQMSRALAAAHAQSIVHRDLKPENVMLLQRPGQPDLVKVLDFGVAKVQHGHGEGGHTAVGMVVGTPQYMSPEQAKAIPVDHRSDIYSLALIFYELLAGRPAFVGETPPVLMVKQVTEMPPPLEPGPKEPVPPQLDGLIFQMLAKKPDDRPQTMAEVVERLENIWSETRTGPFPKTATPRPVSTKVSASGRFASASQLGSAIQPLPESGLLPTPHGLPAAQTSPQRAPSAVTKSPTNVNRTPAPGSGTFPTEEELAAPPKSKLPLIAGLAALVVIGGAATVFALSRGDDKQPVVVQVLPPPDPRPEPKPPDPKPEPKGPETVKFTLKSEPAGAEVYKGDVMLGNTPVTLSGDRDAVVEYTVRANGYKPATRKIEFGAASELSVQLEKEKTAVAPVGPKKRPELHDNPYAPSQTEDLKDNPFK